MVHRRSPWLLLVAVLLLACQGNATPPGSTSAQPSSAAAALPRGLPLVYPDDRPAGDVPARALVPPGMSVTGTWYATTTAGDAIVVAWERRGSDPFRSDRGLAVWRHTADPAGPWRPVFGLTYPAATDPVLGLSALIGDVTGDGSDDALVFAETGGSGACGSYLVLDVANGRQVFDRSVCDTRIDASTEPAGLVVTRSVYADGDPHCCPSAMRTSVLTYAGDGTWSTVSSSTSPT